MKKVKNIRTLVQVLFFVFVALVAISHTLAESGMAIPILGELSLHGICPFGGVVTLYSFITDGILIRKLHESALVVMGLVFILSILFGPVFCSYACPLGSLQEWLGKLNKIKFKIPKKADRILGYARYIVLGWVIYVTAKSGVLVFESYDPFYALFNFWSGEVAISALLILGATILLSVFVERPWCRYACPYGALLGLTNKIRIFSIWRNEKTCVSCGKCDVNCPVGIEVSSSRKVTDVRCISCGECTSEKNCPVKETVELRIGGKF